MAKRRNWTSEETRMAFALYFIIGPSKADGRNEDVRALANAIRRSPSAVALKLANIAACDKNRLASGHLGMSHASRLDHEVWAEYDGGGDEFLARATESLVHAVGDCGGKLGAIAMELDGAPVGRDRLAMVTQRVNQDYFRSTLMDLYGGKCCVTGLAVPQLLVASHIKPWASCDPRTERLAASNGLLLNALHDKAFDRGLMTIDYDYRVHISSRVERTEETNRWLWCLDGERITLPRHHAPAREFIEYHNDVVFQG